MSCRSRNSTLHVALGTRNPRTDIHNDGTSISISCRLLSKSSDGISINHLWRFLRQRIMKLSGWICLMRCWVAKCLGIVGMAWGGVLGFMVCLWIWWKHMELRRNKGSFILQFYHPLLDWLSLFIGLSLPTIQVSFLYIFT